MQDKLKVNSSAGGGAFSTPRIIDRYKSVNRTQGCIFVHTHVIILLHFDGLNNMLWWRCQDHDNPMILWKTEPFQQIYIALHLIGESVWVSARFPP